MLVWIVASCLFNFSAVNSMTLKQIRDSLGKRSPHTARPSDAEHVGCIHMQSTAGEFLYESSGEEQVCAFYAIGGANERVEIIFKEFNVDCQSGGLLAFVDGWEARGQFFPSEWDSRKSLTERYKTYCGEETPPSVLLASQNVALLQFRIPALSQGFRISLRFIKNDNPCNVVSLNNDGEMTLNNHGLLSNCSFSVMSPTIIEVLDMNVGPVPVKRSDGNSNGLMTECMASGVHDYVELLDGDGMDPSYMWKEGDLCGLAAKPVPVPIVLGCSHSVVRLVSSGVYYNSVTFRHTPLTEEQQLSLPNMEC